MYLAGGRARFAPGRGPRSRGWLLLAAWLAVAACALRWSLRASAGDAAGARPPAAHKLLLSWVPFFGDPYWGVGPEPGAFARLGCAVSACELTADRHRVPLERFDALLFHGFEFYEALFGRPNRRAPHQRYVFMSLESARRAPIPERFEDFYNLTVTYRLDSDAPWPYFTVLDETGAEMPPGGFPEEQRAPAAGDAAWNETLAMIAGKTRPVAWFASNCRSRSGRERYVAELARHVSVDTFGACGSLSCPQERAGECERMLGERYFFYLAFENSLCREYVTEKAVTALRGGAVPVLRAGAGDAEEEARRLLPRGSYVAVAADETPAALGARLRRLLEPTAEARARYARLLRWRARYRVERRMPADVAAFPPGRHPLCRLCALLHEEPARAGGRREVRRWWMGSAAEPACRDSDDR